MGRARLALQVLDQRRGEPDRTEQVGVDDPARHGIVDGTGRIVERHHAGIVDEHVERGVIDDELRRDALDVGEVGDVDLDALDARVRRRHSSSSALRRPATMTLLPSFVKASASARPMPEVPPVMKIVLPVICMGVSACPGAAETFRCARWPRNLTRRARAANAISATFPAMERCGGRAAAARDSTCASRGDEGGSS